MGEFHRIARKGFAGDREMFLSVPLAGLSSVMPSELVLSPALLEWKNLTPFAK